MSHFAIEWKTRKNARHTANLNVNQQGVSNLAHVCSLNNFHDCRTKVVLFDSISKRRTSLQDADFILQLQTYQRSFIVPLTTLCVNSLQELDHYQTPWVVFHSLIVYSSLILYAVRTSRVLPIIGGESHLRPTCTERQTRGLISY